MTSRMSTAARVYNRSPVAALTPAQRARVRRIEALIRVAAPALDLVLFAGDRVSRVAGRNQIDPEPPRRARRSRPPRARRSAARPSGRPADRGRDDSTEDALALGGAAGPAGRDRRRGSSRRARDRLRHRHRARCSTTRRPPASRTRSRAPARERRRRRRCRACACPTSSSTTTAPSAVLLTAVARGLGFIADRAHARLPRPARCATAARRSGGSGSTSRSPAACCGAIATIMFTIGTSAEISSFLDGARTVDRARRHRRLDRARHRAADRHPRHPGDRPRVARARARLGRDLPQRDARRAAHPLHGRARHHLRRADRAADPSARCRSCRRSGSARWRCCSPAAGPTGCRPPGSRARRSRGRRSRRPRGARRKQAGPARPSRSPIPSPRRRRGDGRAHPSSRKKKRKRRA